MTALVTRAQLPTSRFAAGDLVPFDGKLYLIGGIVSGSHPANQASETMLTDRVDVYDPLTDSWSQAAPLPRPNADHYTWTDGTFIYCAFGQFYWAQFSENDANYFVYRYDPAANSWITLPLQLNTASVRASFMAGWGVGKKFYALRSFRQSSRNYYNLVSVDLDANTQSDVNIQYASTASSALAAVGQNAIARLVDGKVYFLNGKDSTIYQNNLAVYDPAATANLAMQPLAWPAGLDLAYSTLAYNEALPAFLADASGFLWVIGGLVGYGYDEATESDLGHYRLWKYEIATNTWTQQPNLTSAFGGSAGAYESTNDQFILAGGRETADPANLSVSNSNRALLLADIVGTDEFGVAHLQGSGTYLAKGYVTYPNQEPYVGLMGR